MTCDKSSKIKVWQIVQVLNKIVTNRPYHFGTYRSFLWHIVSRTNMTCDKSSKTKVWQIVHIILEHITPFCDISSRTNVICDKSSNNRKYRFSVVTICITQLYTQNINNEVTHCYTIRYKLKMLNEGECKSFQLISSIPPKVSLQNSYIKFRIIYTLAT